MNRIVVSLAVIAALLAPVPALAVFHLTEIDQLMSGAAGNPSLQFVEIRMLAPAQTFVANTRLTFFSCAAGNPATVLLVVPSDLATGNAGDRWIMASPDDATFFAAAGIHPDFHFAPGIDNACGMICWGAPVGSGFTPPPDPASWSASDPNNYVDCWAYGGYGGPMKTGMTETAAGPAGNGTMSLTRTGANIALACPAPTNDAGNMGTFGTCSTTTTTLPGGPSGCTEASAAATVRATATMQCPCDLATGHRAYLKCVAGVVKQAVTAGTLPRSCRGSVKQCAAKSICGRSGAVTCCRTTAKGARKCSVKKSTAACKAPKGGSACLGSQSSCCDACNGSTCTPVAPSPSTTTTHPRPTSSTTMRPY